MMKNYYKTLQIDPSAEQEVVVGAYRRLAQKYHPDRDKSVNATHRMQELNEAYEILGDPAKRARYDREHHSQFESTEKSEGKAKQQTEEAEAKRRAERERQQQEQAEAEKRRAEHEQQKREQAEREEQERKNTEARRHRQKEDTIVELDRQRTIPIFVVAIVASIAVAFIYTLWVREFIYSTTDLLIAFIGSFFLLGSIILILIFLFFQFQQEIE